MPPPQTPSALVSLFLSSQILLGWLFLGNRGRACPSENPWEVLLEKPQALSLEPRGLFPYPGRGVAWPSDSQARLHRRKVGISSDSISESLRTLCPPDLQRHG